MMSECFGAPDYEVCRAAELATGRDRWALDVNAYSDKENDPYVVNSAAWRALHPLAAAANDAMAAAKALLGTAASAATGTTGTGPGTPLERAATGVEVVGTPTAPSLAPLVIIGAIALLLLRR